MATGWPVNSLSQGIRNRWDQLRQGEYDSGTLRSVPSWGLSVLMHALFLLILALMIQWGRNGPSAADRGGGRGHSARRRDFAGPRGSRR